MRKHSESSADGGKRSSGLCSEKALAPQTPGRGWIAAFVRKYFCRSFLPTRGESTSFEKDARMPALCKEPRRARGHPEAPEYVPAVQPVTQRLQADGGGGQPSSGDMPQGPLWAGPPRGGGERAPPGCSTACGEARRPEVARRLGTADTPRFGREFAPEKQGQGLEVPAGRCQAHRPRTRRGRREHEGFKQRGCTVQAIKGRGEGTGPGGRQQCSQDGGKGACSRGEGHSWCGTTVKPPGVKAPGHIWRSRSHGEEGRQAKELVRQTVLWIFTLNIKQMLLGGRHRNAEQTPPRNQTGHVSPQRATRPPKRPDARHVGPTWQERRLLLYDFLLLSVQLLRAVLLLLLLRAGRRRPLAGHVGAVGAVGSPPVRGAGLGEAGVARVCCNWN